MAIPTFVQKSRINQVIYQIRDGKLLISERALWENFRDRELNLQWLDPEYRPGITRNYTALIISLVLAALCGAIVWGGLNQSTIPREAVIHIIQWPALCFAAFLTAAIQWSRRIEYYAFNNRAGKMVLVIIRERDQAEECATFIATLVAQIEVSQSDVAPEEKVKLLRALDADRSFSPATSQNLALWKIAIVLGALAAGLPWVPSLDVYLIGFLFPIVFSCCAGGAIFCVFSFLANEPRRWWSAIGLILSLVPPFFYG